jgi:hypothetical protein
VLLDVCILLVYDCLCAPGALTKAVVEVGGDSIVQEARKIGLYIVKFPSFLQFSVARHRRFTDHDNSGSKNCIHC